MPVGIRLFATQNGLQKYKKFMNSKGLILYLVICPRVHPMTFAQFFALESSSKSEHCRNVLGRILGQKKLDKKPLFDHVS